MKKQISKLAIIVPYRNRKKQLDRFIEHMKQFFDNRRIDYHIFVVEQADEKLFNQGKLLNIGYSCAMNKKHSSLQEYGKSGLWFPFAKPFRDKWMNHKCSDWDFTSFAFHDVDLLPEKDVDYSYPIDSPIHLAGYTSEYDYELQFADYFGGVTLFTKEQYQVVNGRSNNYLGWGFEDDDLLYRCKQAGLAVDSKFFGTKKTNLYSYLSFDGYNDYIKIGATKELKELTQNSFSISVTLKPDMQHQVENIPYDEHFVFSIPGYHCGLSYTSHRRYKADMFDSNSKSKAILSDIQTEYFNQLTMVYNKDMDMFTFYQNGEIVDSKKIEKVYDYTKEDFIYIGCANPKNQKYAYFFKGEISEVAVWNDCLDKDEVKSLYNNNHVRTLTDDFDDYTSSKDLLIYYDFKHIVDDTVMDNSGWYNSGKIFGAKSGQKFGRLGSTLTIPHRRYGGFSSQEHKKSAWAADGLHWIHPETRDNQTRFFNKVKTDLEDWHIDGLTTLKYKFKDTKELSENCTLISVEL
mgnify:FL=1